MSPGENAQAQSQTHSNDEMIGSLGEALAGVNLGPNTVSSNGFSFPSQHDSTSAGDPFRQNNDWGNYRGSGGAREDHSSSPQENVGASQRTTEEKSGLDLFLQQLE